MTSQCDGRFPALCASIFPEVSYYDYEDNLATRGIDNRTFRWEDINVKANWVFLSATTSGEFEYVTGSFTSNGPTGNKTLTYSGTVFSGFTGWVLSGGYTHYIGQSGSLFSSSNLSGYTGSSFWSNPIEGNTSIGLWNNSSSTPLIISEDIIASASGIQLGQKHQVYLQSFVNKFTNQTPKLRTYVQALISTSIVGYYNPIESSWTTQVPTGCVDLSTETYTEIKYDFTASSFGFSTPDRFKLVIENPVTGSFVTVDDVHIDQYMQMNPFLDYIIPTGYLIQITPDLGWHDTKAMLDGDGTSINPFIKTFGPFTVEQGNLTDNLDNTVSATIDSSDFNSVTSAIYSKYLWRAIAISPNGELGKAGLPERFTFVGKEIDNVFNILEVREDPLSPIKTIVGSRTKDMSVLVDGRPDHPGLEYVSDNRWSLNISVDGQYRIVTLQGKHSGGATSSRRYVELHNKAYELRTKALWNIFDEHGVLLDLRRLPSEPNTKYRERLIDSNVNRGGPTFVGLANSSTREIGLKRIDDCITLSVSRNKFNTEIHESVEVEFGSVYVKIRSNNMRITERLYVDPVYNTIELSKAIFNNPINIISDDNIELPLTMVEVDIDSDRPSINRVKINYQKAHGRYVTITYDYMEVLYYKTYTDVYGLVSAINNLTDGSGSKLVSAKLSHLLSGNESTLGLFISSFRIPPGDSVSIPWTPIKLRRVSDKSFREHFLGEDNTYNETKFQEYVNELKNNSRTLWGNVEADRDYWDAVDPTKDSFDYLPTIFDPVIANYSIKSGNEFIDGQQAWARNFRGTTSEVLVNKGLDFRVFHPGIAHINDLTPDIHVTYNKQAEPDYQRSVISEIRNNNENVIFSGQR